MGLNTRIIHFKDWHILRGLSQGSQMAVIHEYVLRDHLGNTRVTFSDANNDGIVSATDIKQINNYYPFGLNMEGNWILHETLHLLGLSDRYTDHGTYMGKRTTTPDKGFEHDIMATNSLNISRAHYIIYLVTAHDVNNEKVFNRVIDRDSKGNKIP